MTSRRQILGLSRSGRRRHRRRPFQLYCHPPVLLAIHISRELLDPGREACGDPDDGEPRVRSLFWDTARCADNRDRHPVPLESGKPISGFNRTSFTRDRAPILTGPPPPAPCVCREPLNAAQQRPDRMEPGQVRFLAQIQDPICHGPLPARRYSLSVRLGRSLHPLRCLSLLHSPAAAIPSASSSGHALMPIRGCGRKGRTAPTPIPNRTICAAG